VKKLVLTILTEQNNQQNACAINNIKANNVPFDCSISSLYTTVGPCGLN